MTPVHVRTLLDADAMGRCLGAIPVFADRTAHLRSVTLERVGVKPARDVFHTLYRVTVDTDTGRIDTHAWAALLGDKRPPAKALRMAMRVPVRAAPPWCHPSWSAERSTAVVESPPMLVQLFPWDYRLPNLSLALDAARVQSDLLPSDMPIESCAMAGYWPGVRCQIRYQRRDPSAGALYGKLFARTGAAEGTGRTLGAIARALDGTGGEALATPRVVAYLAALDLLVTEPVDGEPLPALLHAGAAGESIMSRVAAALARFHALSVPEITRTFGPADDFEVVRLWIALVSAVFPGLAAGLAGTLAALERAFPADESRRPALVHRDLYDAQVVVGSGRIGMLDLDTVCRGDAEIDVANFCAHLVLRAVKEETPFEVSASLRDTFVDAYRARWPGADMRRISWYFASALLRLACVYAIRPWGHGLAPRLLETSRRVLEGSPRHGL